ncbi:MAG: hypothetical protein Q7R98_03795 [Candidatus Jorgensenbacteria bacterium]|nr:hypothetical protein [Candidatus Jorgensenbacteria bacterium]
MKRGVRNCYRNNLTKKQKRRRERISRFNNKEPRSFKIGKQSEEIVVVVLEKLKDDGLIKGFKRKNARGIDFIIFLWDGRKKPFQVKSSWYWVQKHYEKFPNIPVVVVGNRYPDLGKRPKRFRYLVNSVYPSVRNLLSVA